MFHADYSALFSSANISNWLVAAPANPFLFEKKINKSC